ncbi:MAG: hypothetical protein KatS3mg095_0849 [Candidatus Parcubacteria bacterium]|nr:MAG: hypothetical protein KatS3mg095_0849 [Candidatus Parcubacteria bacterium]
MYIENPNSRKRQRRKRERKDYDPSRRTFLKILLGGGGTLLALGSIFKIIKIFFSKEESETPKKLNLKKEIEKIDSDIEKIENYRDFSPDENIKVELSEDLKKFIEEKKTCWVN